MIYVAKIDLVSEVEETIVATNDMQVYPNPFMHSLQIYFPEVLLNGFVRLTDMSGKEVYFKEEVNGMSLDMNLNLLPGIYLMQVADNKGWSVTKKIIASATE